MKKNFLLAVAAVFIVTLTSCEGSYIVTSQPATPYYDRGIAPGDGYVWIDGDWFFEGGHYVYHNGYWGRPRGHRTWQTGHWESRNNGYTWRRGRWH